jgi:hypothetical protein
MIRLYCGIAETRWNHHPVAPGAYACVSPVKGKSARTHAKNSVFVPTGVKVIQDSGAFSDSHIHRLSFEAAYARQLAHAEQYHYADNITHRASYDLLIDEVWTDGNRHKRRWSVVEAEEAVTKTIAAAEYAARTRHNWGLVQSAQGVTAQQYLRCVERVIPHMDMQRDMLGLGGWCITGKMPKVMMGVFQQTIERVIPYAARQGVKHVHIWGVLYAPALGLLLHQCDLHGLTLSTDSVGPSTRPAAFGTWGYADWVDKTYRKAPVETRGLERARHVQATIDWLQRFRHTQYYPTYDTGQPRQMSLFQGVAA